MTENKHENAVLALLELHDPVVLELGCGQNKKHPDALGIDAIPSSGVDICGDIFDVLLAFPDNCVDEIYSYHFFEHVVDLDRLIHEIARITKVGGSVEVVVPHFSNPYFYSDPTHRTFFGLYTFCYFTRDHPFSRSVPTYSRDIPFRISEVRLNFKSTIPFYVRHLLKRTIGRVFDSSNYMRELYEEWFSPVFPCYEIRYVLNRVADSRIVNLG